MHSLIRRDWPLVTGYGTAAVFYFFHEQMLGRMENPVWATIAFVWLFAVIMMSAATVVRHSEAVASIANAAPSP